ncbi:MAG TPA: hypothetical protein VGD30_09470 [Telluria sp.]
MGTRIEPTISHHPGAEPTIDDIIDVTPDAENPELPAQSAEADASTDPTLAELAALENEVDNWLHPPAKAEPVAMEAEPAHAEVREQPAAPAMQAPPAPRRKRPVAWWAFGAAALAAIAGAAVLMDKPAEPRQSFEQVAATTPAAAPAPAQAAIAPVPAPPASKPEMVFLDQPASTSAKAVEPKAAEPTAMAGAAEPAGSPAQPGTVGKAAAAVKAPVKAARKTVAQKTAKPAKKTAPAPQLAQRTQTWPPDRRDSDARRVEAARAECRARSRDPGACHIRVCDVLGSSHPACRD